MKCAVPTPKETEVAKGLPAQGGGPAAGRGCGGWGVEGAEHFPLVCILEAFQGRAPDGNRSAVSINHRTGLRLEKEDTLSLPRPTSFLF